MRVINVDHFSENEQLDRIRLIRSRSVGALTFHRLIDRFGNATQALQALPEIAQRGAGRNLKICSRAEAEREWDQSIQAGATLVFHGEAAYPPLLATTDDAPAFLSIRGSIDLLKKKSIAVVGARNASLNGQHFARQLAGDLGRSGLSVVSGLALGIDAAAHARALASGTVAVLGGGVDVLYPRQNQQLYDAIAESGALVSEARPGERPTARHFPRRNRIISGMSRGVVVVEASPRSGSLITARLAAEQGRDVFAVPGAAYDPRSSGTNRLLRDGAIMTENIDDILDAWETGWPPLPAKPNPVPLPAKPMESTNQPGSESVNRHHGVLSMLSTTPSDIDDVLRHAGLPSEETQMLLTEMELDGRLVRHPGGKIALRAGA